MGFATATGIDSRLFYFVPLSTLFTVVTLSLGAWVVGGFSFAAAVGGGSVFLPFAIVLLPLTLPPALLCWVVARLLFWKAGFGAQWAALLSGVVSGLGAMAIPAVMSPYGVKALSGVLGIGLAAGLSGGLAALIVYWDGWQRLKSGGP